MVLTLVGFLCMNCDSLTQTPAGASQIQTSNDQQIRDFLQREVTAHVADIRTLDPPPDRVVGALTAGEFSWGTCMRTLGAYSEFAGTRTMANHEVPQMTGKMAQIELRHGGKTSEVTWFLQGTSLHRLESLTASKPLKVRRLGWRSQAATAISRLSRLAAPGSTDSPPTERSWMCRSSIRTVWLPNVLRLRRRSRCPLEYSGNSLRLSPFKTPGPDSQCHFVAAELRTLA